MTRRTVQTERCNGTFGPNIGTGRCNRVRLANMQVGPVGTGRPDERSGRSVATSLSPKPFSLSPSPFSLHPSPRPQASLCRESDPA